MRRVCLAAAVLAALAVAYTWPLPLFFTSAVAHDRGDPLLVTWLLWWSTHHVPLTAAWWNAPAFYPSSGVFAFSENMLGLAPIAWPIIALTRSPLLAYNTAFVLSYVLSGLGAYLLGWVLTRRHDAAFLAALAFAFAPYRLSHTQHLQLLSSYWMPVAIAALHLYAADARRRWAALFAASWLMQALACGYYFFYLSLFAALWLAWFGRRLTRRALVTLGGAWLAAGLALAPVLVGYKTIQGGYGYKRSPVEIVNYSADVAGLWSVAPESLAWRWLNGGASSESQQFPGVTVVALAVAAVALASRRRAARADAWFYAGAAVLVWTLGLGPRPALYGRPIGVPGPYALLAALPGFDGMRVPARLWMVAVVCLSACAALALARIESARVRRLIFVAAAAGLLVDGWPSSIGVMAAPPMRVTRAAAVARLGLPMRFTETESMYGAIAQDRPVFNGYTGYVAPQHPALLEMLEHHDPRILPRLAATAPIEVVIEHANDPDGSWRHYVERQPGARRVDGGPDWSSYTIAATGAAAPARVSGQRLAVAAITASTNQHDIGAVLDDDLDSRWNTPRQDGGEVITADLGRPQHVTAVEMCLGAYASQYPRTLAINVSADGSAWTPVYTGDTVLATYDAAIASPREVPVTFMIQRDQVRFVRLRQLAADTRGWSIVELRVIQ